jgi:hypothetical protein
MKGKRSEEQRKGIILNSSQNEAEVVEEREREE